MLPIDSQLREALNARGSESDVWIDSPANLYQTEHQAETYLTLMQDEAYTGAFHDPVRDLLESQVAPLLSSDAGVAALIDLGPGYPDKSFPVLERLMGGFREVEYIPVDINSRFLAVASEAVRERYSCSVVPRNILFEDVPGAMLRGELGKHDAYRVVLIGLTFMNFRPREILPLLRAAAGRRGMVIVATELPKDDIAQMCRPYEAKEVEVLNREAIAQLQLPNHCLRYIVRFARGRIEMGFCIREETVWEEWTLPAGMTIVTALSYRHSAEALEAHLLTEFAGAAVLSDAGVAVGLGRTFGRQT